MSAPPFTLEELRRAASTCKQGTAAGGDGIPYEALQVYAMSDRADRLLALLNQFLLGEKGMPPTWKVGDICLLPKVPQPPGPQDLRPIALTPCLCKLFSRMLLTRLERCFPTFEAGQFGCRKGCQTTDGIATAQLTMQLCTARHGQRPCVSKLDIKAAFDSLSLDAVLEYMRHIEPSQETWRLWELISDSEVRMRLGTSSWSVPLRQGLLQGTAYSAILFGRVVDFFLGPLLRTWEARWPHWKLPFLLLYADDVLLLAPSTVLLQQMTQEVVDLLSTLGLHVNPAKCAVLDTEEGVGNGVFLRGHGGPLKTEPALLYLGVPLSFDFRPLTCFARALGRCANTYFAMRNLFKSRTLPAIKKVQLFDLYVTSKWLWCSGLIWPTKQALVGLNSQQTTLLLGLLGFRADFFGEFLHNVVAKRRAVRLVLDSLHLETWGSKWLRQVWRYWGHVARSRTATPLRFLVQEYGTFGLMAGTAVPGWTVHTPLRKMQLTFTRIRHLSHPVVWEKAAEDRDLWQGLLVPWKDYWDKKIPSRDLLGRQLVLLGQRDAVLRRFRVFPEAGYATSVCNVLSTKALPHGPLLWGTYDDVGVSVAICPRDRKAKDTLIVQESHPVGSTGTMPRCLHLWNLIGMIHDRCSEPLDIKIVLPPECLSPSLLNGDVPLAFRLWYLNFESKEQRHDMLPRTIMREPTRTSKLPAPLADLVVGPFPLSRTSLTRDGLFQDCVFHSRRAV